MTNHSSDPRPDQIQIPPSLPTEVHLPAKTWHLRSRTQSTPYATMSIYQQWPVPHCSLYNAVKRPTHTLQQTKRDLSQLRRKSRSRVKTKPQRERAIERSSGRQSDARQARDPGKSNCCEWWSDTRPVRPLCKDQHPLSRPFNIAWNYTTMTVQNMPVPYQPWSVRCRRYRGRYQCQTDARWLDANARPFGSKGQCDEVK